MRGKAWLFSLAGCGRLAFDASTDDAARPDSAVLPASVCAEAHVPLTGITTDTDLVATALPGAGTMMAWLARQPSQVPTGLVLDTAGNVAVGPQPIVAATGDRLETLVELGGEVYLQIGSGVSDSYVTMNRQLGAPALFDAGGGGTISHNCLLTDLAGTHNLYVFGNGTGVNAGYATNQLESYVGHDTTVTLDEIECFTGQDHAHVNWETAAGACNGIQVQLTAPQPTFGGGIMLASDCREPRSALVTGSPDTGTLVYRQNDGAIMSTFITDVVMPAVEVSPGGHAPRVQSDGTRIWLAWINSVAGVDELHVGYRLPLGPLAVDIALPGYLPAGDEALELVRDGTTVKLAVLTQTELALLTLCP